MCELLSIIIAVYSILMKTKDIFSLQWYEGTEDTKIKLNRMVVSHKECKLFVCLMIKGKWGNEP